MSLAIPHKDALTSSYPEPAFPANSKRGHCSGQQQRLVGNSRHKESLRIQDQHTGIIRTYIILSLIINDIGDDMRPIHLLGLYRLNDMTNLIHIGQAIARTNQLHSISDIERADRQPLRRESIETITTEDRRTIISIAHAKAEKAKPLDSMLVLDKTIDRITWQPTLPVSLGIIHLLDTLGMRINQESTRTICADRHFSLGSQL